MAVNYDVTTQTNRMAATLLRIDGNASPASIEICTAGYAALLVSIPLLKPSFNVGSGPPAELIMIGVPRSGMALTPGTAALARIKDGGGNTIVNGLTVSASDGTFDIFLNSVTIDVGQVVTLTSGYITHAE